MRDVLLWTVGLLLPLCSLCSSAPAAQATPRVALLFICKREMPLENTWVAFLDGIAGLKPPEFSSSQQQTLLETTHVDALQKFMDSHGVLAESSTFHEASCVSNDLVRVCQSPENPLSLSFSNDTFM